MWVLACVAFGATVVAAAVAAPTQTAKEPNESIVQQDQTRAAQISLQRTDLRGRVRSVGRVTRPGTGVGLKCTRQPDLSDLTVTGSSFSPLLEDYGRYLVGTAVEIYRTAEQARTSFERQTARDVVVPCLGRFFIARAEQGRPLRLRSAQVAQSTTFGEATLRYRFVWRIQVGRRTVPAYTDLYFMVEERVVVIVGFFSAPKYLTAANQQAIVARIAARA